MEEEKIFGLTLKEVGNIADQLNKKVDTNHPAGDGSWDSFIKAFEEGERKMHADKEFMSFFNKQNVNC